MSEATEHVCHDIWNNLYSVKQFLVYFKSEASWNDPLRFPVDLVKICECFVTNSIWTSIILS